MKLKYDSNGKFKIMQITDTHIGNMPFHEDDHKTFHLLEKFLSKLDVDLVIHTGDVIWSDGVKNPDIVFKKTLEIFNKYDVPVAITFGNHDTEETVTRSDLRYLFNHTIVNKAETKHVCTIQDRQNYVIEIFNQSGTEVENVMYVLDSGAESSLNIGQYAWIYPEQVSWFKQVSDFYKKGDDLKRNIIFQHIPIPEYWQASDNIIDGKNLETNERISAPHLNTGLFSSMLLNGETWGMFVGHDHENDFHGVYHDIHLVYGKVSGYQTYGDVERGVRMIELDANNKEIKTYTIRIDEL